VVPGEISYVVEEGRLLEKGQKFFHMVCVKVLCRDNHVKPFIILRYKGQVEHMGYIPDTEPCVGFASQHLKACLEMGFHFHGVTTHGEGVDTFFMDEEIYQYSCAGTLIPVYKRQSF